MPDVSMQEAIDRIAGRINALVAQLNANQKIYDQTIADIEAKAAEHSERLDNVERHKLFK